MGASAPFILVTLIYNPDDQSYYQFKCRDCGYDMLVEVMEGVTVITHIESVCPAGDHEYKCEPELTADGQVIRYQCDRCGTVITDDNGQAITDCEMLYEATK